ncbi:hypothetical protein [Streptomyces sp. AJS327]|uniref:hypothetical protein n=1 Tax=Streptomyces sp. AJS327 TaxID=2545265 RepID=UPI0027E43532|nr:hypothetical protein [Streptomyces sp. AJS327]
MRTSDEPTPEPIRFYGTTWVGHSGGYALRRIGLGVGSVLSAALGAVLLRLAYEGLTIAEVGGWVNVLIVVAFALCSSMAFSRTLATYTRAPEDDASPGPDGSLRSVKAIGFIGVLLAYALRTLVEAPGEKLRRAEYEQALERATRRRTSRTGNPAARRRAPRRKS